jgi:multisubunit Na+/H+ antiporter MnhC subunit
MDMSQVLYMAAAGLMLIGIAGIVLPSHLVRIIFGIALLEAGANLLLLLASFREGTAAPIMLETGFPANMADPVPQALVLTAIVIGVGILALALILALRVRAAYGTLDMRQVRQRMERDIAEEAGISMPISSQAPRLLATKEAGRRRARWQLRKRDMNNRHPSSPFESSLHFQIAWFCFVIVNTRYYVPAKASTSKRLWSAEAEALAGAWLPKSVNREVNDAE